MKSEMIKEMLNKNNDKLNYHKQEFERTLKTELCNLNYFSTTSIENLITFLTRLQSNVGKCEGKNEDLKMLHSFLSIKESNEITTLDKIIEKSK